MYLVWYIIWYDLWGENIAKSNKGYGCNNSINKIIADHTSNCGPRQANYQDKPFPSLPFPSLPFPSLPFPSLPFLFSCFFFPHFYFPASGQAVVTGVVPFPPRCLPLIFIAHRVQQSHCSSIFHRVLLTHALALSASQFVHKKKSQRIYTSMHSAGLELTKLILLLLLLLLLFSH